MHNSAKLAVLESRITRCTLCPRLVSHREHMAAVRRRAYIHEQYWGRPVPGFGDPLARLLIVGLAPAAHGGNRTGRIFTGDRSGDFLYQALFDTGFANQPTSRMRGDGLELHDAYITAGARCAPPDNRPTLDELANCRPYLLEELRLLQNLKVVVALGSIALDSYLRCLQDQGRIRARSAFRFGHGNQYQPTLDGPVVLASYHPSQQNTSTRRLTATMLAEIFAAARSLLG